MFDKKYEQQLIIWREFRDSLETSDDPLQDTIDFFKPAPETMFAADPYSPETWPTPWELINENVYCPFIKILAICYTLQLTDRFSADQFEIHITQDQQRSATEYLLFVADYVIGFDENTYVHKSELPLSTVSNHVFPMQPLQ